MTEKNNGILASIGDWDNGPSDDENKNNTRKRSEWMKFPKPGSYRVRLAGKHVEYLRYANDKPFADKVITHDTYKGEDPAWNAGFYPRWGFAIHVIDRSDGKVKILDKGRSVYAFLKKYKAVNGISPSSATEAPDFVIDVEWPNGNKLQAKYTVTATAKATPLTEEEKALLKANAAPLQDIYKSTPLEKIKELWNALPEDKQTPPAKEDKEQSGETTQKTVKQSPPPKMEEPVSPADEEDLFGDNSGSDTSSF